MVEYADGEIEDAVFRLVKKMKKTKVSTKQELELSSVSPKIEKTNDIRKIQVTVKW